MPPKNPSRSQNVARTLLSERKRRARSKKVLWRFIQSKIGMFIIGLICSAIGWTCNSLYSAWQVSKSGAQRIDEIREEGQQRILLSQHNARIEELARQHTLDLERVKAELETQRKIANLDVEIRSRLYIVRSLSEAGEAAFAPQRTYFPSEVLAFAKDFKKAIETQSALPEYGNMEFLQLLGTLESIVPGAIQDTQLARNAYLIIGSYAKMNAGEPRTPQEKANLRSRATSVKEAVDSALQGTRWGKSQ